MHRRAARAARPARPDDPPAPPRPAVPVACARQVSSAVRWVAHALSVVARSSPLAPQRNRDGRWPSMQSSQMFHSAAQRAVEHDLQASRRAVGVGGPPRTVQARQVVAEDVAAEDALRRRIRRRVRRLRLRVRAGERAVLDIADLVAGTGRRLQPPAAHRPRQAVVVDAELAVRRGDGGERQRLEVAVRERREDAVGRRRGVPPGPSYTPVTLNDIAVSSTPSDSVPIATTDQSPRAGPGGTVQVVIGEVMGPVPRFTTFALISTHPDGAASLER